MKNNLYIGYDIASSNAGIAHLRVNGDKFVITYSETVKIPDEFKQKDGFKAVYQQAHFKKKVLAQKPRAITIEAPALSCSFQMESIGFIHGAIVTEALKSKIPFTYIPPTKLRFGLLGSGHASKKEGIKFVNHHFTLSGGVGKFDDNQADAVIMAYFAYVFDCLYHGIEPIYLGDSKKSMKAVFLNPNHIKKYKKKGEPPIIGKVIGIIHRPNDFYFNHMYFADSENPNK